MIGVSCEHSETSATVSPARTHTIGVIILPYLVRAHVGEDVAEHGQVAVSTERHRQRARGCRQVQGDAATTCKEAAHCQSATVSRKPKTLAMCVRCSLS